jgi:hypothetical protein
MRAPSLAAYLAAATTAGALLGFLAAGGSGPGSGARTGTGPASAGEEAREALRREIEGTRRRLEESEEGRRAAAAEAARLREELAEARRDRPGPVEPPSMIGWWYHSVDGADPSLLDFRRDGVLVAGDREVRWSLEGWRLRLSWPDPAAPGGAWEDACVVAADGLSYAGRNQSGNLIRGTRKAE